MDDIVERAKAANRIEDVFEAEGISLQTRGRYRRSTQHDSLVVDVDEQAFFWNSRSERGDVITWLQNRHGWDFKTAIEWLCRQANLPEPEWSKQDVATRLAVQAREDALEVAARIFVRWLWKNERALAYARGRGWTDETLQKAYLGFSGSGTEEERKELTGELSMAGVDLGGPAAAAILGYRGDVAIWAERNGLRDQLSGDWIEKGYIPGMLGQNRLVYPHVRGGKIRYLSARSIVEKRHYNLPEVLVGERLPFFNQVYGASADTCVIVEGQADAISLGQLGQAAVALAGVALSPEIAQQFHHNVLYTGLDDDQAGQKNAWSVASALGPLTRLVRWGGGEYRSFDREGEPVPVKDANDLLRALIGSGLELEGQQEELRERLKRARTLVEVAAALAGSQEGAERDSAIRKVFELVARMNAIDQSSYRQAISRALNIPLREYNAILKATKEQPKQKEDEPANIVETTGGWIENHLVEWMYETENDEVMFAVRTPDGHIDEAVRLDLGGVRYIPMHANALIRKGAVLLPSKLGAYKSTRELVTIIRMFIHRYLDVDPFYERLASYYVLFTWVYDAFQNLPYLRALGDYGTGKTRFIQVIGSVCYRPMFTGGASTTSPVFRMLDAYKGTLIMDEADFGDSSAQADIIKIFNTGYMKGMPVLRTAGDSNGHFEVECYDVFGPKVIATRKKFADRALESRCMTKEMGGGVPRFDIPIVLPKEFWEQAREVRNLLLMYRMKNAQPEMEVDYNSADRAIEARLNQVTLALKTIVDDADLKAEIDGFIKEYNRQLIVERSMTLEAKVLDALVAVHNAAPAGMDESGAPYWDFTLKNITKLTNQIINDENRDGDVDEDSDELPQKSSGKELKPKRVGGVVRNQLQLQTERASSGPFKGNYLVIWDDNRIKALCGRYGVQAGPASG